MRLDKEGRPDANQFTNPEYLGVLQGSGRMETTNTRNEFRNDVGATSSSMTIDKVVISGGFLYPRDMNLVKRLVPYTTTRNSNGVRQLRQGSVGCAKKMRLLMIWRSPDCDDVPVFDAIEFGSAQSYTLFNLEIGKSVQSNIPLSIEAFPDSDGVIWTYYQFDKHFHRIGS